LPTYNRAVALLAKYYPIAGLYVVFSGLYLWLSLITPADQETLRKYHISKGGLTVLILTIALPYIIIWFVALIGLLGLRDYAQAIKKSRDGAAFNVVSQGIFWLTLWLPLSAILGALTTYIYQKAPSTTAHMVQINNYGNILLLLPAFWLCYVGTGQLIRLIRQPERTPLIMVFAFVAFAALYTFLTLHDTSRRLPAHGVQVASYYLPDWLIVTTIVIPRLLEWFLGFQAAYNLYLYRTKVKGKIYKRALTGLAAGLAAVVTMIAILRCLQSLSTQLGQQSLNMLLLIIYLLLILIAVGYGLISRGARDLKRIESL